MKIKDNKNNHIKLYFSLMIIFWASLIITSPVYMETVGKIINPNIKENNHIIKENNPIIKENNFTKFMPVNESELEFEYKSFNTTWSDNATDKTEAATDIVVLNYHGVYPDDIGINETQRINAQSENGRLTYNLFKEHMFTLKKAGYEAVDSKDLYLFLKGEKKLPKKSFVITFDDGVKNTYYNTDRILKFLNYKAVMFVIVSSSLELKNSAYYLNKEELHKMQDSGRWDLESHSYRAHKYIVIDQEGDQEPYLINKEWILNESRFETDQEYVYRINNDLNTSKELLEKEFNKTIIGFSLPFGELGQRTNYPGSENIVISTAESIYSMLFIQFRPATNVNFRSNFVDQESDFYSVKRISADRLSTNDLLGQMEAAESIDLPFNEKFENPLSWVSLWGDNTVIENNYLNITSHNNVTSGEMLYLDGSYNLKDYNYSVIIKEIASNNIFLIARFNNSKNYVACRFDNTSASIMNIRNNNFTNLATSKITKKNVCTGGFCGAPDVVINPLENLTKLSISVNEKNIGCYVNDNLILNKDVNNIPSNGGIGIRVEGVPINRSVLISSIKVDN